MAAIVEFDGERYAESLARGDGLSRRPTVREAASAAISDGARSRDRPLAVQFWTRRIVHIAIRRPNPELSSNVRRSRHTVDVAIPLLRDGEPIGAIASDCREPGGFSDSQIELLKTFAEQAVIAITSAETYRALQTRTSRSSGIAGIPDRDQRRAEGHQPLDLRSATRAGYGGRDRRPALRCRHGRDFPPRGRVVPVGGRISVFLPEYEA